MEEFNVGISRDKSGAHLFSGFEVDKVTGEVTVDMGIGVDVDIVEVGRCLECHYQASITLPRLAGGVFRGGIFAVFGV